MSELTFPITAGAVIRGQVRRALKQYAFGHGYKIEIDEDKGLLDSLFQVTLHVPDGQAQQAWGDIQTWAKEVSR